MPVVDPYDDPKTTAAMCDAIDDAYPVTTSEQQAVPVAQGYAEAEVMLRDLILPSQISDTAIRVARDHMMQFHRLASLPCKSGEGAGRAIYVASRASIPERGAMWREYRAKGVPINSTWIDEDGPKASRDLAGLWDRIRIEVTSAERLVLYVEPDDFPLKGAFIEVGMALAANVPVMVVAPGVYIEPRNYRPLGSWMHSPLVSRFDTVEEAFGYRLAPRTDATQTREAELLEQIARLEKRGAEAVIAYHVAICSPKGVVPDDNFYDAKIAADIQASLDAGIPLRAALNARGRA